MKEFMTYEDAVDEVRNLAKDPLIPDTFKPSLKKVVETMEIERFRLKTTWIRGAAGDICPVCSSHTPKGISGGNYCSVCGTDMRGEVE